MSELAMNVSNIVCFTKWRIIYNLKILNEIDLHQIQFDSPNNDS